jgi:hypothetical protein
MLTKAITAVLCLTALAIGLACVLPRITPDIIALALVAAALRLVWFYTSRF